MICPLRVRGGFVMTCPGQSAVPGAGLMSDARAGGRERGKSGPIDALASARGALREDVYLPAARLDAQVLDVRRALLERRASMITTAVRGMQPLSWIGGQSACLSAASSSAAFSCAACPEQRALARLAASR